MKNSYWRLSRAIKVQVIRAAEEEFSQWSKCSEMAGPQRLEGISEAGIDLLGFRRMHWRNLLPTRQYLLAERLWCRPWA